MRFVLGHRLPPRMLQLTMPDGKQNVISENSRGNSSWDLATLDIKKFIIIPHLNPWHVYTFIYTCYFYFFNSHRTFKVQLFLHYKIPHVSEDIFEISLQIYFPKKIVFHWCLIIRIFQSCDYKYRFSGLTLQQMNLNFQKRGLGV